tara:strand:+ start:1239 stop:1442 length:204 start_codon:yes stop_codon:yes gene_type:complete
MPQRTLRFRIRQDGRVEELVEGVLGTSCNDLTKNLEDALGTVEFKRATSEAFLQENIQTNSISAKIN